MSQDGRGSGGPVVMVGRRQGLKKGPWTTAEDSILMEYVRKHGEGNWNAVQRNSGLMRCGKSCRLRWANHLRPNLKKGAITAEEERFIIELHAKFGNKWARMAAQLPGRTDNEIKNYWNTRVKRRQRAGLPIYPREAQHQHNQHHHYHHQNLRPSPQTQPNSSLSSLSSLLSPPPPPPQPLFQGQNPSYNPTGTLFNAINFQTPTQNLESYLPDPNHYFKLLRDNNGGLALSVSSSPTVSSGPALDHQGLITTDFFSKNSHPIDSFDFSANQNSLIGAQTELHSIQTRGIETTQDSNGVNNNIGSEYMAALSSDTNDYEIGTEFMQGNSGLLGDLLGGSHVMVRVDDKSNDEKSLGGETDNRKSSMGKGLIVDSTATKVYDITEDMIMDDDLVSLLDFQMTPPVPDWYDGSDDVSNGQSTDVINDNVGMDNLQGSPQPSTENTSVRASHEWSPSEYSWFNLPTFLQT